MADIPTFDQNSFWDFWGKTKLGNLRNLRRKEIQDYYDYFSIAHYKLDPGTRDRSWNIAAEDRMKALQSELEWRGTRDLQIGLGILAAIVLIGAGALQHFDNQENARASTVHPTTQTALGRPLLTIPASPSPSTTRTDQSPASKSPAP